ncbi:trypsin-like serine protease [Spirosoma sp. KCTC 42546]|uniref:S1C family serine protease n=1 Tax=Spirosoma sp. KCTC 42546 TaxID=2520506 RepID=UPI00115B7BAF|nr:S1C family serine protease [Spirosoma sp. KCTC 42546]QDK79966.1 trypsin-like serine protease [Spirosoma sp. KCTC 42546]
MKRFTIQVALLVVVSLAVANAQRTVYKKAIKAFVTVRTDIGFGSGFFIDSVHVVTNRHVIAGATSVTLIGSSLPRPIVVRQFAGLDSKNDVAILKTVGYQHPEPLYLANQPAEVAEAIFVIGSPEGFDATFSNGLVSGYRTSENRTRLLQFTAPISPGSSGGPVLNHRSEVVGVVVSQQKDGQNLNFAVPLDMLKAVRLGQLHPLEDIQINNEQEAFTLSRAYFEGGKAAFKQADFLRAEQFLRRSLTFDSTSNLAKIGLADALYSNKKDSTYWHSIRKAFVSLRPIRLREAGKLALSVLADSVRLESDLLGGAWLLIGRIRAEQQQYIQAMYAYRQFIAQSGSEEVETLIRAEYDTVSKLARKQQAEILLAQAKTAQPKDQAGLATKSIGYYPLSDAYYIRGTAWADQNQLLWALRDLDSCLLLNPDNQLGLFKRGYYRIQIQQPQLAVNDYLHFIDLNKNSWGAWCNFSVALLRLGRHADAELKADQAVRLAPKEALSWLNRAQARLGLGKIPLAIDDLNMVLKVDPKNETAKKLLKDTVSKL